MARVTHRNDRMHRGLVPTDQLGTGSATATTVLLGNQTWGSAPGASFGSNATEVGNASAGGSSSSNSRADHVHKGVHSLTAAGSNALYGDVNVAAGSGIAVTQSGQSLTITNTGTSSGGAGTLTIEEADGNPTGSATKLVLPNGTLSYAGTVATYTPAASGGSSTFPTLVQVKYASIGVATTVTLDDAPANGHVVFIFVNAFNTADPTAMSSTNTTWSKLVNLSTAGGAKMSIWAGVVSGGAGGATVTITHTNSFLSLVAIELVATVTPTAGQTHTSSTGGLHALATTTAGHLVVMAAGADNTTQTAEVWSSTPAVGFPKHSLGVTCVATISQGGHVYADWQGGAGGVVMVEVT
jgi:hypothetical protein